MIGDLIPYRELDYRRHTKPNAYYIPGMDEYYTTTHPTSCVWITIQSRAPWATLHLWPQKRHTGDSQTDNLTVCFTTPHTKADVALCNFRMSKTIAGLTLTPSTPDSITQGQKVATLYVVNSTVHPTKGPWKLLPTTTASVPTFPKIDSTTPLHTRTDTHEQRLIHREQTDLHDLPFL